MCMFAFSSLMSRSQIINAAYVLGDAADVKGGELPTKAEVACQKAEYLARCLNFDFQIDEAFADSQKALVTYIGQHDGVNGGNKDWSGAKAWMAWRSKNLLWRTRS
ncbi:hypothetical protein ABVK25_011853 [Lepraria finkii]|uniref:Uncharacterized protein n=1 Tax=Lepraria finkii TaxID=1340010 RepID=A0ABR4AMX4_9LECA